MEKIKNELKDIGFDTLEYLGKWDGYKVYSPIYTNLKDNEVPIIGLPLYVLEKDDEVRLSDDNECFKIMKYFDKK